MNISILEGKISVSFLFSFTFLFSFLRIWKGIMSSSRPKLVVSSLYYYPVKSCRGIRVKSRKFSRLGFLNDRCWMIVRKDDSHRTEFKFVTAREVARMVLIIPSFDSKDGKNYLLLDSDCKETLRIPVD
eukprot:Sdes_comp10455_c0_seq1m2154